MARKKVVLAHIPNDSVRRSTFKKRRKGFMKKVSELSTLCGIEACAVVYAPGGKEPVDVFPSMDEAKKLLDRFDQAPEPTRKRNMKDQGGYLTQRIDAAKVQLRKREFGTREAQMTFIMKEGLAGRLSMDCVSNKDEIEELARQLNNKVKEIDRRIAAIMPAAPVASLNVDQMSATAAAAVPMNAASPEISMSFDVLKIREQSVALVTEKSTVAETADEEEIDGSQWMVTEMSTDDYMFYGIT